MSRADPRLSGAVTAHSLVVAGLSLAHSLRTRRLRRTLILAALGTAVPVLGELIAVHVLKLLRHHVRPQAGGVPLAVVLGWYNVGYGTLAMVEGLIQDAGLYRRRRRVLAPAAALAATSLDLLLDPFGLDVGLWEWRRGGSYAAEIRGPNGRRGIPLLNFGGWLGLIAGVALAYQRSEAGAEPAAGPEIARGAALLLLCYYLPAAAWALERRRPGYLACSAPFAVALGAALKAGSSGP